MMGHTYQYFTVQSGIFTMIKLLFSLLESKHLKLQLISVNRNCSAGALIKDNVLKSNQINSLSNHMLVFEEKGKPLRPE